MADTTKIYENIFIKKNAAGDREYIKVPYAILADPPTIPDVSGFALTSDIHDGILTIQQNGTNVVTFGANQSTNATANITTITDVKMNGTSKVTNGVADLGTVLTDESKFATSAQGTKADNAMPKAGGAFTGNVTFPTVPKVGNSSLALKTDIPPKVTESTVSGWGFTKNKGTVTSVAVKMNGSTKGTVTSSGTIDLGTVITDISGKLDKTTYEVNKTIDFDSSGVLYVGKFKVYDTNVTCEVTSTTNVTYSGKLVIATQNYVIAQMTVYGDAANTVAPSFFVKPSTTSNPYIEVYFKPASWSKNVVHIYGSNIQAEPTDVCTNVPSVPSTATLKPKNALPTYSLSGTTLTITL